MAEKEPDFRSGYVAIIGKPNAGKSTLLNALVGEKIAIVSDKPQTTRDRIAGVLTTTGFQVVFLDTPGIIEPQDRFNEVLVGRVTEALEGVDVLYHLVDVTDRDPLIPKIAATLAAVKKTTKFLVLNKTDKRENVAKTEILPPGVERQSYDEIFYVSALKKRGLDRLIDRTVARLSPGPMYYDPEQLSDRDMRFIAAETVREKVFRSFGEEIPYSVFTEVETYEEKPERDHIRVVIYIERDSQKGILIGEGGRMLKKIGKDARLELEKILGKPVYLELWVKLRKNWRKNEADLNNFGFKKGKR